MIKTISRKFICSIFATSLVTVAITSTTSVQAASTSLTQAVNHAVRTDAEKARDQYRHPEQTLSFFGITPNMTVVEMIPGGGWYTDILAPYLKANGKLYAAMYPNTGKDDYYSYARAKVEKLLASNKVYSQVTLTDFLPKNESNAIAPEASADMVLTFRNLHNWGEQGIKQFYLDAFKALKSGGVLGVVEHRMPESFDWKKHSRSGYVKQSMAIALAEQAGFKLAASSEINANSKDNADHPKGVWTLPPVLRLKEQDKAKYLAIGESDRMTLKFIKP